jgi:histidinol-phosphatase (PHP family)
MQTLWDEELGADLDRYVEVVLAAKAEGLPVVLGLEVDYYQDRMHDVSAILDGYPFDVLLGSVHWIGAWGFDNFEDPAFAAMWDSRTIESIWDDYTRSLEELADSGVCDVLAHPDLCKISGRRPEVPDEFYDRMAEAAARSGMAAEVNTNGWRKPIAEAYPAPPLLARFRKAGVPVTTATDAHTVDRVAERGADVRSLLTDAGYGSLQAYTARTPRAVAIG